MTTNRFSLTDKKVLIIGGNSGIGLGTARCMIEAGAQVAITGSNQEKNDRALLELQELRADSTAHCFDLNEIDDCEKNYNAISEQLSGIDILVCNAGITHRGQAEDIPVSEFQRVMRINVDSYFAMAQAYAREHIANGEAGAIVMTASLMSEASRASTSPYTTSKGAVRQLVKALACDWAKYNIRVNGVGPGYIKTDMTKPLHEDEEFYQWLVKRAPLARWGEAEEIGNTVVFLASEASSYITGQIIYIDGGFLASF
ncbi:MAG: SDR family oxidoreductase [Lentisphaeria bacterium]|nr:SDR family oxidoreductase [Lentisphaeria bacterium]NQZ67202.1 SDR family oxidoreductase [Lentisphaeria bacterium]